jgi:hypothetical protein
MAAVYGPTPCTRGEWFFNRADDVGGIVMKLVTRTKFIEHLRFLGPTPVTRHKKARLLAGFFVRATRSIRDNWSAL